MRQDTITARISTAALSTRLQVARTTIATNSSTSAFSVGDARVGFDVFALFKISNTVWEYFCGLQTPANIPQCMLRIALQMDRPAHRQGTSETTPTQHAPGSKQSRCDTEQDIERANDTVRSDVENVKNLHLNRVGNLKWLGVRITAETVQRSVRVQLSPQFGLLRNLALPL